MNRSGISEKKKPKAKYIINIDKVLAGVEKRHTVMLKNIPKSFKNAITIKNQSRSYMKNMLENAMLEFLHTGEKQRQD